MTCLAIVDKKDLARGHVAPLLRWAKQISDSYGEALQVLCCFFDDPIQLPHPIKLGVASTEAGLLNHVAQVIESFGGGGTELMAMHHPDPVKALLEYVQRTNIQLLVLAADGTVSPKGPEARLIDRALRFAPCDIILLDAGDKKVVSPDRILVPAVGSLAPSALRSASQLAGDSVRVAPLLVGPHFGDDAHEIARKELDLRLREADVDETAQLEPTVVLADSWQEGIIQILRDSDMILVGANSLRALFQLRETETRMCGGAENVRAAIAIGRPAKLPEASRWAAAIKQRFKWLPKLKPNDRVDIFDRLQTGARPNVDFLVMMGLSTAIASLGLLQSSTAVVIGAMLVAPLMTPLIAAGLALVQGNVRLFRHSMLAMGLGVLTGFSLAALIGLLTPRDDLTMEVLARGSPDILDLFVAFISGMAAAYAFARPNLMGTLAGVAIAAALVPPLAASAIALARWVPAVAEGAAILHLTNLVAIILGAALVFHLLGVQGTRIGIGPSLWLRRILLTLVLLSVFLMAPLGYKMAERLTQGQMRPLAFPLSVHVFEALEARVRQEPGVELVLAGRTSFAEETAQVGILLSADHTVSEAFINELKATVAKLRGQEEKISIWVFKGAIQKPGNARQ